MISIILDILIYNYTPYQSFFFLTNINNKSLFYNISLSLYIDIFITHTYILNTIFIIIFYLLKNIIKPHNLLFYLLFNLSILITYNIIFSIIFNKYYISIISLLINIIYILISYINKPKSIFYISG